MNRTKIEWTDYTSNPVKGLCPMACSYCYARAMYKRFKWNPEIRFVPEELAEWNKAKDGSKIFVGSTIELFGEWVPDRWMQFIFDHVRMYPNLIFQFLTKQSQNLAKFSPFPENCRVGVTATNPTMLVKAYNRLICIDAKVKFVSIEPFLSWGDLEQLHACKLSFLFNKGIYPNNGIDWLIIGAMTGSKYELELWVDHHYRDDEECPFQLVPYGNKWTLQPPIEHVQEIIEAADRVGIPIFLKDNLNYQGFPIDSPLLDANYYLRQEMPA